MRTVLLGCVWLVTSGTAQGDTELWPQWRGPCRDGKVEGKPWPDKLSGSHLQEQWRVELGESYSGPIIAEDRIFVTETKDKKHEVVRALDRKTGKEIWQAKWPGAMSVPFFARSNGSWIRATPAYDGKSLFVAGMKDVLVCLDAKTGKERWRVDFTKRYQTPLPSFGFVCSPLVTEDAVYVQAGASVVKLDKTTGKSIWRALNDGGGMWGSAFSSPVLTTIQGTRQLLVQTRSTLAGLEPKTGKTLWSQKIKAFRGMNILTPTVYGDQVFTSAYGGKTELYKINQQGNELSVTQAWNQPIEGYMSSPVVIGDHAYLHLKNRRFCCIDLKTGKEKWRSSVPFGQYWSMVAQKDRILALDEKGILYLIQANPEKLVILDKRTVSKQPTWAHLAVCGEEIVIRELRGVISFRWVHESEK